MRTTEAMKDGLRDFSWSTVK